ncbi:MAG: serine hydrolase [Alphaproteobacteria bacterium]|jgi:D-alanyl-D-alanine carboxypeptidase|nr:serine hydrolase [Alphaproteobacteria bacterium]MBP7729664.1 serine hydrolase [Alphaproteobacteria bacterium]
MQTCRHQAFKVIVYLLFFLMVGRNLLWAVTSSSIVICAKSGAIQHEHNADAITHPASLTKMMTLYLTFKAIKTGKLKLTQNLRVSKFAAQQMPCKLWLKAGSTITVREAILALITKSANDAATALAETLGNGSEARFAQTMTLQARELGMSKTIFKNASGVPNKQQVTTARDMATLSRALYKDFPEYFHLFKTKKFVHKGVAHANHNHLLGKVDGVDGIKTGFICSSGFNLAASMTRGDRKIIAVVMGGESIKARDTKTTKLLESAYANFTGKKGFHNQNDFMGKKNFEYQNESITDLLQTLGHDEAYASSPPAKLIKAINTPTTNKAKLIKVQQKSNSLDDIINDLSKKVSSKQPKSIEDVLSSLDSSHPRVTNKPPKKSSKAQKENNKNPLKTTSKDVIKNTNKHPKQEVDSSQKPASKEKPKPTKKPARDHSKKKTKPTSKEQHKTTKKPIRKPSKQKAKTSQKPVPETKATKKT